LSSYASVWLVNAYESIYSRVPHYEGSLGERPKFERFSLGIDPKLLF